MKTPEQLLLNKIRKKFNKGTTDFGMLEDGDRILIGLSGGKDSLCLLQFLAERSRIFKPNISIEALHVRMENIQYESDASYLEEFARSHGVPLHIITTSFDEEGLRDKPACFLCSWYRRKALFRFALDNGFNKIALGHHMDDILHTTLLNLFYEGTFSTMPAVMRMEKMPLTIIRPLCLVHEADIAQLAQLLDYHKQNKTCPYEKASRREDMRQTYEQMEKANPEMRYSILRALQKEGKLT